MTVNRASKVAEIKTLIAKDLVKSYSSRRVLDGISFSLSAGEAVALLGPNGAGKTTSFDIIVGLIPADSGSVWISDKAEDFVPNHQEQGSQALEITHLRIHERARLGIGYLTQEPSAFRQLTARENLELVFEEHKLKDDKGDRATELLREFGILHLQDSLAISLSGGERRRLEITRVLAAQPSFVLLDEPFTGIDPIAIEDIQGIIRDLAHSRGIGVLITDHNPRATLSIVDRAYIVQDGRVIKQGSSREIAEDELVRKYYLGQSFSLEAQTYNAGSV